MLRRTVALILPPPPVAAIARAACPTYVSHVDTLLPADGTTGVPLNGGVSFSLEPTFGLFAPKVVLSSGGGPIPGALAEGPFGAWTFRPDFALSPTTTYFVLVTDQ